MKQVCMKIAKVLEVVYGYGIVICLFVGGLTVLGYIYAIIVGGESATAICAFIHKSFFPKLIYLSTVLVLHGLVKMYLSGEKTLTGGKRKSKEKLEEVTE